MEINIKILAFDLGGSSGKIYIATYSGNNMQLEEIHRFTNHGIALGSSIYWDFLYIYTNLVIGIKKANMLYPGEIKSIGIDSFCNDFGLINRAGDLLMPIHCYRDERTLRYKDILDHIMPPRMRHQYSGNQNSPSTTLMHLASMREAGQEKILSSAYKLLHIPDLLIYYLTGNIASEYTIASVSQMYDYYTQTWSEEILKAYKIPKSLLPNIIKPGTHVGTLRKELRDEWNLPPIEVIAVCEHDTASAYLAAPCKDNSAIISSGTWCLTGIESNHPIINKETFMFNIANEGGYPGPHHRILKCNMGLWLIQEVRAYYASVGQEYTYLELDILAAQASPFTYLINPDDEVFFSQGNMPLRIQEKCMEVYGSCPQSVGEIVRCILESLALKFCWTIDKLEHISTKPIVHIQITGGGCQDKLLGQYTANACNRFVHCGPVDAAALGNATVQFLSHKAMNSVKQARSIIAKSYEITTYYPTDTSLWEQQYQHFLKLYHLE